MVFLIEWVVWVINRGVLVSLKQTISRPTKCIGEEKRIPSIYWWLQQQKKDPFNIALVHSLSPSSKSYLVRMVSTSRATLSPFPGKDQNDLVCLVDGKLGHQVLQLAGLARTEVLLIITTIIINKSTTVINLAIRSCSWLTRKDGGRAATPPCGMVINSLKAMAMIIVLISGAMQFLEISQYQVPPAYRTTETKSSSFCGHDSRETLRQKSRQQYYRSTTEQIFNNCK